MCCSVHAALFVVAERWKPEDGRLKKTWPTRSRLIYSSASSQEEVLSHAALRVEREGIVLSGLASHRRTNTAWFHLYVVRLRNDSWVGALTFGVTVSGRQGFTR